MRVMAIGKLTIGDQHHNHTIVGLRRGIFTRPPREAIQLLMRSVYPRRMNRLGWAVLALFVVALAVALSLLNEGF
jgi:hypothetical protein